MNVKVKELFKKGKNCKKIPKNCAFCNEWNKCVKCHEHSTFNFTTQSCECNQGFRFSKKKNLCKSKYYSNKEMTCTNSENQLCKVCLEQEDCKECKKNSILSNNKCLCKEGFYQKRNQCYTKRCSKNIVSCAKCEKDRCMICKKDSFLNEINGKCSCKRGYYYHKKSDTCKEKKCSTKIQLCEKCNGENICTQCKGKSIYDPTKNACFCKFGYKYNHILDVCQKKICTKKIKLCENCNSDNICTKCKNHSKYSKQNNKCNCIKGFLYNFNTNKCQVNECGELCISCDERKSCSQCSKNSFYEVKTNKCICEPGYYLNKKANKCKKQTFMESCKIYRDGNCEECVKHAYLKENKKTKINSCICEKGYYFNLAKRKCEKKGSENQKICSISNKLCISCNQENKCNKCKKNSVYDEKLQSCVCVNNYKYNKSLNKCQRNRCEGKISLCKSCNDNNTCFKCVNNSVMDLKTKECKCKLGYEYNKDSDSCKRQKCKVKLAICKACDKENKCLLCKKNAELNNNICQCKEGYSHNVIKNKCVKTNEIVNNCVKNQIYDKEKDECICKKDYIFDEKSKKCVGKKFCIKKYPLCKECNSHGQCNKCLKNSILDNISKTCKCKDHYKFNNLTKSCELKKCNKQIQLCKACDEYNECIKCKKNSFYDHKIEGCHCSNGFYHNKSEDNCQKINMIPLCYNVFENLCKICVENATLDAINNKCTCNNGYFERQNKCIKDTLNQTLLKPINISSSSSINQTNNSYNKEHDSNHQKTIKDNLNSTHVNNSYNNTLKESNNYTINNFVSVNSSHNISNDKHGKKVSENELEKSCDNKHLCTKCHDGVCTSCKENAVIIDGNCECKDECFYNSLTSQCENSICESFKALCSKCYNHKCIQCLENAHLNRNNECKCNKNYYYDENQNKCLPDSCNGQLPLCAKCNNKGKCKKCKEGSNYNHIFNICLCEPKYYHNIKLDQCVNRTEENLLINKTLKCQENSFFNSIENKCQCKKGYYFCVKTNICKKIEKIDLCRKVSNGKCIKCKKNSKYDSNLNECKCAFGFKHKKKYDYCEKIVPTEEKCKTKLNLCVHCRNEKCYDCKNYAEFNKTNHSCECKKGYFYSLEKDECFKIKENDNSTIIEHYHKQIKSEKKKKCEDGKDLCKECYSNKCIKCEENSNLNVLTRKCECLKDHVLRNDKCINIKKCKKHNKLCKVCEKEKCFKCKKHTILQSSKCSCKNGYLFNSKKDKCSKVYNEDDNCKNRIDLCKNCFGGDKCLKCKKNSFLKNGKCQCLQGYIYNYTKDICKAIIPENLKCKNSETLCKICNDKDNCLKCKKHSIFNTNKKCVCEDGFKFDEKNNKCNRIIHKSIEKNCKLTEFASCRRCKNDKCVECKKHSSFDLKTNSCLCKNGFHLNNTNMKCERLPNNSNNDSNHLENKNLISFESSTNKDPNSHSKIVSNKTNNHSYHNNSLTINKTNDDQNKNHNSLNHSNSTLINNSYKNNTLKANSTHKLKNSNKSHKLEKNCKLSDFASCKRCKHDKCLECQINSIMNVTNNTCVCIDGYLLNKNSVCEKVNILHENTKHNISIHNCSIGQIYDEKSKRCINNNKNYTVSNKKKGNVNLLNNPYDPFSSSYEPLENINFCEKGFKFSNETKSCLKNSFNSDFEMKYVFSIYLHGHRTPKFLDGNKSDILGQKWNRENSLSLLGQRNDYLSGHFFKDRYMHQTEFLSKFYEPNEIRVDSANNEASLLSAYSFLRGLYSEKKVIEKGRYDDVDKIYDSEFPKKKECFRFKSFESNKFNSEENLLNIRFNRSIYEKQTSLDKFTLPFGLNQIPVHSNKIYQKNLGLDKLSDCKGGYLFMEHAYHNHKDEYFDTALKMLNQEKNLIKLLHYNNYSNIDLLTFYNITDSINSNYLRNNSNITSLPISKEMNKMLSEFKNKLIYNILFENQYLSKLVSTNSMKKLMKHIDNILALERDELNDKNKNYKEKIESINQKLLILSKFNIYFPSEEIFWGIMTYVSDLVNLKLEIAPYSSSLSFELVKNSTGFNPINFMKEVETLRNLDLDNKEVKEAQLDNIFRENYGNPDKYFINIFFNDKNIGQLSINSLREHINRNLLSLQEVETFCFPKKMTFRNIFILLLISFVIFEILILACIYTIKN